MEDALHFRGSLMVLLQSAESRKDLMTEETFAGGIFKSEIFKNLFTHDARTLNDCRKGGFKGCPCGVSHFDRPASREVARRFNLKITDEAALRRRLNTECSTIELINIGSRIVKHLAKKLSTATLRRNSS